MPQPGGDALRWEPLVLHPKLLKKNRTCAADATLHGAHLAAKDLGRGFVGHALGGHQHDGLPLARRQFGEMNLHRA